MTDAERKLWRLLRNRALEGAKFRRQVPLGPYVADFLSFERKIVVELDGGQHATSKSDARRDTWFVGQGFRTLRFWNNDILNNPAGVLEVLAAELQSPSPGRCAATLSHEGRGEERPIAPQHDPRRAEARLHHPGSPHVGEGAEERSFEAGEGNRLPARDAENMEKQEKMTRARIHLFDTTLRDGAQTADVDFSLADKVRIVGLLDRLGVDYIEGGYPGANPTDTALFAEERPTRATFTAFGMTKRAGRSAANDPGLKQLLDAKAGAICFVAKAWDFHVSEALGISNEENIQSIRESVRAAKAAGREVLVDCEHFFDGYKANPAFALACARAAYEEGARWVVLCDTNGGSLPGEVARIVDDVAKEIPGENLGIHAHDDLGLAVANSLAAVDAGVRQVQGTLNGLGERCGNANLVTLIPALKLKDGLAERYEIGVSDEALAALTDVSRVLDEVLNRSPDRHAPFVGANAFATKAGIHASAILKNPRTYEHVEPESVGNHRKLLVSDQGGRSNILAELDRRGIRLDRHDARVNRLLEEIKERESFGYAYEAADASFVLLARRLLGEVPDFFEVESFRVMVERRHNALGKLVTMSEAVVKVRVDGEVLMSVAEGNGPVNALDLALRKDLGKYQPYIGDLRLTDYRVRILNGGTEAVTRVLIESTDSSGETWTTVGVSPNIIDASFQALTDSLTYKLLKSGAR